MSSFEYIDMFLERQNKGKYHMFTFDIVGSKKMNNETRRIAQEQMEELMKKIYNEIKQLEDISQNKILVMDIDGIVPYEESGRVMYKFGMLFEPWIFGDTFGFTIYRDSLPKEVILTIYEKYKKALNIPFDFHIADGYYETNKWEEGSEQFFRGYCLDILLNYHKEKYKYLRKIYQNKNV